MKQLSDLDFGSAARVLNLPAPGSANEPARLADLNAAVEGLAWKDSCRVASTANINLSSPGATIDGVSMSSGDRVLVKDQSTASENGIYVWTGAASAMTRALDCDTAAELEQAVVTVEEGTSAGATFRQTTVNFTLGSGSIAWTSFGTSAPSASETTAGIAELATQAETDTGTDDARIVTPLKLATWAGRTKRYQATIGDGSSTQIDVTHNFATRDIQVQVWQASGNYEQVHCDVRLPGTNTARLNFASAPASSSLRVVILA